MMRCNASTDFLVKLFSFTITYVDPNTAGNRLGERDSQPFSWYWAGDDESILLRVTLIIDMTILTIANTAIARLPDRGRNIRDLSGCLKEAINDGGLYARNVTTIFDHNTAAGWVQAAMRLNNPTRVASLIVANMAAACLVPRRICIVAAATFRWRTSFHLHPRR
jgi:hypothetical protein